MNVRTRNLVPWYDTKIVRLAYSRDSLYHKALNSKSAIDWNIYKLRRQEFSKLFRTKKSIHHKKFIIENSKNTKKHLKKINPYTNPNKKVHINPSVFSKNHHVPLNLLIKLKCSIFFFRL